MKSGEKCQRSDSSPISADLMSARVLERIEDVEAKILRELTQLQNTTDRRRFGMMAVGRTLNLIILPVRTFFFFLGAAVSPVRTAKLMRDWMFICRSRLFDKDFYLREYPEVAVLVVEPVWHYCSRGWKELRNPRPDFSTAGYLERNRDIKSCGMNPFYHYVRYRKTEPCREGTARPPTDGGTCSAPRSVSEIALQHVPTPLREEALTEDAVVSIRDEVRKGLYGNC